MKKIYLLFAIAALLVSCKEDYYETKWKVIDLEVNSKNWTKTTDDQGLNMYYFCYADMPEITDYVFDEGSVQAYYVRDDVQEVLPSVKHYEDNKGHLWTQNIDFDFSPGGMNFYVTNSDFYEETPPTMHFRVVLMW